MVQARRFLITLETLVVLLMGLMGAVVYFDRLTPVFLLSTNFILSVIWSLASPAWLSTTPLLVAPRDLAGANAANSVGYNLSRAVGPAAAGETGRLLTLLVVCSRRFVVDRSFGVVASS